MVKIENHCCECSTPGYPCIGDACVLRNVEVHYCDHCDEEIVDDEIYEVDGEELCEECLKKLFRKE